MAHGGSRQIQDGRVDIRRHEEIFLATAARHACACDDERHAHATFVDAALGPADPLTRIRHRGRYTVVTDEDDDRLFEIDFLQQSADLGVQALNVRLVERNVGRDRARRRVADRAEIDTVKLSGGRLVRGISAVGGMRCVVRLIDEPRLPGVRCLVLMDVVDRVVREGGRRVRLVGDRGRVDVIRHPVEVVRDATAEEPSERGDSQVTYVLENLRRDWIRDSRARVDGATADVVLAEESVTVVRAVAREAVEEGDGRGRQHVTHVRDARAVTVLAAHDGAAGRRAHGARPGVVEHEAVLRERFDVRDRHRAAVAR